MNTANELGEDEGHPSGDSPVKKGGNCFICWRRSEEPQHFESSLKRSLGHHNTLRSPLSSSLLKSQLSVIFLLRNVLGIPSEELTNLLEKTREVNGGEEDGRNRGNPNPSEWGIKLCGSCHVMFREAEFIYKRLVKFQADFHYLAKELRQLMLMSLEAEVAAGTGGVSNSLNESIRRRGPGRKRKAGRPPGKRKLEEDLEDTRGQAIVETRNAVKILRSNFAEIWNGARTDEKEPEIISPAVLFTTHGTSTVLDNILTTQPVKVNVIQKHVHIINKREEQISTISKSACFGNNEDENKMTIIVHDHENEMESTPVIIKEEIFSEDYDDGEVEEYLNGETEYFDGDGGLPSPDPAWIPDDNDNRDEDQDGCNNEEEDKNSDRDSDYEPESSKPKKKDRRFTRKKPNIKENTRKKKLRELKATSFDKIAPFQGKNVEPVESLIDGDQKVYLCPHEGCEEKFPKKMDCHVHVFRDHYDDPMPYHCHVCDSKRFVTEMSLRRHMSRFHRSAKCPFDEDYDPNLHSAETLMKVVEEDKVWQSCLNPSQEDGLKNPENPSDNEDLPQATPTFPEEVLKKFRNEKYADYRCRHHPCRRKFSNEMLRDGHEKRIHLGNDKPFECELCQKPFPRRTKLLEHLTFAHYSNQSSCPHCGGLFADKVLLAAHIGRAHLGDNQPFKCPSCPRKFPRRAKMNMHMYRKHGIPLPKVTPKRKILARNIPVPKIVSNKAKKLLEGEELGGPQKKCWICHSKDGKPMLFDTPEDLKEHIQEKHNDRDDDTPFRCPVQNCDKAYRTNGKLDCHIVNYHKGQIIDTPGEYKCSHCDLTFHRNYMLDAHLSKHGVSLYMCNFCPKQFRAQKYLNDHQRQTHYKELKIDPFKCKDCGKVMNTKKSLNHHIKMVHTKETPFNCKVPGCNFGTMYPSSLQVHLNIKHGDRKNAICHVCSKTFPAQFYLNRHMRVHTGEKPYKCMTCGKDFSDMPTYNRHVEAHLGKVHKCPLENCGKEYNTRHAYRIHLKQHQSRGDDVKVPNYRNMKKEESDEEEANFRQEDTGRRECSNKEENGGGVGKRVSPELPCLEPISGGVASSSSNYLEDPSSMIDHPPPILEHHESSMDVDALVGHSFNS